MLGKNGAGAVGLPGPQRRQNRLMVKIGARLPAAPPRRKEKARRGCLQFFYGLEQARHGARRQNNAVKLAVRNLPILNATGAVTLAGGIFRCGNDLARDIRRGMAKRQTLKAGTHLRNFLQFGQIELGHPAAPARQGLGQPLEFQQAKRFAHGNMADPKLGSDVILPESRARRDLSVNNAPRKDAGNALSLCFAGSVFHEL